MSLVFRQHVEPNINATVVLVRLSLSNDCLHAATPCSMLYQVAAVLVVDQVAEAQVVDPVAGAQG